MRFGRDQTVDGNELLTRGAVLAELAWGGLEGSGDREQVLQG